MSVSSLDTIQSGAWEVSHADYHADRQAISHSALEVFRRSPILYKHQYIDGHPPSPSASMQFGSLFHQFMLENEKFTRESVILTEDLDMRTKRSKEIVASLPQGAQIIEASTMQKLNAMRYGLHQNLAASKLLCAKGENEQAFRWQDQKTGLWLKMKPDMIRGDVIINLKTAHSSLPQEFRRAAIDYGYCRGAAFYLEGSLNVFDAITADHYLIVVSTEPPHETHVYRFEIGDLDQAARENRDSLNAYAKCLRENTWFPEGFGKIEELRLKHR